MKAEQLDIQVHTKSNKKQRDVKEAEEYCLKAAKKVPGVIQVEPKGILGHDPETDKYVFEVSIIRTTE